jgi:hypothetical protein
LARELIAELDHPDIGRVRRPKIPGPLRSHARPDPRAGAAPPSSQSWVLATAEIERLAAQKIIRLAKT